MKKLLLIFGVSVGLEIFDSPAQQPKGTPGRITIINPNGNNSGSGVGFAGLEVGTNGVRLALTTNIFFDTGVTGYVSSSIVHLGITASGGGFSAYETATNGTRVALSTNVFWDTGVTGYLSGTTLHLGATASATQLSGSPGFINLSVQAAKLPSTNYIGIDGGWQAWESIYYETNAEGIRTNLSGSWQFVTPPDYATNTAKLYLLYSLLATNGPNTSNVIFGAEVLVGRPGTTNNIHTNLFGAITWGTNNESAFYDQTNAIRSMTINLGTSSRLMSNDLGIIRVTRDAFNDTYGGAISLHGLQIQYTR